MTHFRAFTGRSKDKSLAGTQKTRTAALAALAFAAVALFYALASPFGQDPAYHNFADSRSWQEIPNVFNVLSNLPFLVVGLLGLTQALKGRLVHDNASKYPVYFVFFIGVAMTGLGSSYYHWAPDNSTLVWDRLPMTVSFAALAVAILSEHVMPEIEKWTLYPMICLGIFSVLYWYYTELQGRGDLRLYALVQFLPLLMIPIVCILFQSRYTRHHDIYVVLGLYGLAKLMEHFDARVFTLTRVISGHTLKHLLAALAVFWLLRMLRLRKERQLFSGVS